MCLQKIAKIARLVFTDSTNFPFFANFAIFAAACKPGRISLVFPHFAPDALFPTCTCICTAQWLHIFSLYNGWNVSRDLPRLHDFYPLFATLCVQKKSFVLVPLIESCHFPCIFNLTGFHSMCVVFSLLTAGASDKILMVMTKKHSCQWRRKWTGDQNNLR